MKLAWQQRNNKKEQISNYCIGIIITTCLSGIRDKKMFLLFLWGRQLYLDHRHCSNTDGKLS